jgi:hypothetical protein
VRNLSIEWTKGLDDKSKARMEETVRSSTTVLARLLDILDAREAELSRAETVITDYDTPNWSVRQAHRNGERAQLRKLKDLLGFFKEG